MKILACGLLSAMLLAGTAAALESISQPIAISGYTYYAIRADGALLAWGDSFHGAVGPTDQDPLPWEEANVLLENARYVDAGFITAAAIDEDGTLWGWGGHAGRTFGEEEPYRLLEDVVSVSVGETVLPCALTGRCGPGAPGPECPWRNIRMIPTIRLPRYWTRWFSCLGIWR